MCFQLYSKNEKANLQGYFCIKKFLNSSLFHLAATGTTKEQVEVLCFGFSI